MVPLYTVVWMIAWRYVGGSNIVWMIVWRYVGGSIIVWVNARRYVDGSSMWAEETEYDRLVVCAVMSGRQVREYKLFVGRVTSQRHASVYQERICSDSCTCYHKKTYLTQSRYTDPKRQAPGRVATGLPISKSLV